MGTANFDVSASVRTVHAFRVIASEHGQRIEDCPPDHQGVNFLRRGPNGREDDAGATVIKTH